MEDGDWQFHSGDVVYEEDARIISLGEMIDLDHSIVDLADLPIGYEACRIHAGEVWNITKTG